MNSVSMTPSEFQERELTPEQEKASWLHHYRDVQDLTGLKNEVRKLTGPSYSKARFAALAARAQQLGYTWDRTKKTWVKTSS